MSRQAINLLKHILLICCAFIAASCTSVRERPEIDQLLRAKQGPTTASTYGDYLTARYAVLNNNPEAAADRYARTLKREPNNTEVLEKAVYAYLLSGQFDAAAKVARTSRTGPVGVAPLARLVTAVDAFREEDYQLVVTLLEDKDLGAYNAALANLLIAWAMAADGDVEGALMRMTVDGDDYLQQINGFSQAYVLTFADRKNEALALLELGWRQGLRLPIAEALQARLLIEAGEMDEVKELLDAIDVDAGSNTLLFDVKTRLDRGETFPPVELRAGEGAALSMVGPVATLSQPSVRDLSIVYLELVKALDPTFHGITIMLADRLGDSGSEDDAMALLKSIDKSSPYYAAGLVQQAWLCRRMEDEVCGRAAMEAALKASSSRAVKVQAGDYFRAIEDYERAEVVFKQVATSDAAARQDDWRILFALGATRERLGKWDLAEADLKSALEIEPDRPEVLNYLGYSWIDRGENIPAAFLMIRRALEQRPRAGYIVDSLGWAYYRLGRYDEAVLYLERAAELDPGDPVVNDHLGDAYWRIGKRLQARYQWKRVKMLDPDAEMLQSVERKLNKGLLKLDDTPENGGGGVQNGELQ